MAASATGNDGVGVLRGNDLFLVGLVDAAFVCGKEARSHLNAFSAQSNGGSEPAPIGDAACGDNGDGNRIAHRGNKRHGGKLADVTAGLAALGHNGVRTAALHALGKGGGSHHGDNRDACFLPHVHVIARVAGARGNHGNLHLGSELGQFRGLRVHQHDVQAEGLVRQLPGQLDLGADPFHRGGPAGDDAQSAGFANRSRQLGIGNPCHAPLDNRLLNTQ